MFLDYFLSKTSTFNMNSMISYANTFTKNLRKYTFHLNHKQSTRNWVKRIYWMNYSTSLVSLLKRVRKLILKLFGKLTTD